MKLSFFSQGKLLYGSIVAIVGILLIAISLVYSIFFFWGTLVFAIGIILVFRCFIENNIAFGIFCLFVFFLFASIHTFSSERISNTKTISTFVKSNNFE